MLLDKDGDGVTINHQISEFTDQSAGENLLSPAGTLAAAAENVGGVLDVAGGPADGGHGGGSDASVKFTALGCVHRFSRAVAFLA
jgi:hypothetical protein